MKVLTLQIRKENFQTILSGEQKVEHRFVYPSNMFRYVYVKDEFGNVYTKDGDAIPEDVRIEVLPVEYDALYLINGRRKDAPRLTVRVEKAEIVQLVNEQGEPLKEMIDGEPWYLQQVHYHLGEVISTENV